MHRSILNSDSGSLQITSFPKGSTSSDGSVAISNSRTKFRDSFSDINTDFWTVVTGTGDTVVIDGNAGGASYIKITKNPLYPNTETMLTSKEAFEVPMRLGVGISVSKRVAGQDFSVELVKSKTSGDVDSETPYTPVELTGPGVVVSTSWTFTSVTPHGLVVGDRVIVYGRTDTRSNLGPLLVTSVPTPTTFTIGFSITNGSYGAGGFVTKCHPLGSAMEGMGTLLYGTTANNADAVARDGHNSTIIQNWNPGNAFSDALVNTVPVNYNQAYTYAFLPKSIVEMYMTMDHIAFTLNDTDSTTVTRSSLKREQTVPDPSKKYKIRFRGLNWVNAPTPVGRITAISRGASTTATVTVENHGLDINDYVTLYGMRDTAANFPLLTTPTKVASIVNANQFTIVFGSIVTSSSYGGCVFKIHGGNVPAVTSSAVQSISLIAANRLQLQFLASQGAATIGESVCVYGLVDSSNQPLPQYEGLYRVANNNTTTFRMELDPMQGQDLSGLTTTNVGGTAIFAPDYRLHFARVLDYTRHVVEAYAGKSKNDAAHAMPVTIQGHFATNTVTVAGTVNATCSGTVNALATGFTGGTLYTTNLAANSTVTTTAVDFQSTTNLRTKYNAILSTSAASALTIGQSADNISFEISSVPRTPTVRVPPDTFAITSMVRATNVVTVTTTTNHNFKPGQWVSIVNSTGGTTTFNGNFQVVGHAAVNTFTFNQSAGNESATASTGSVTGSAKHVCQVSCPAVLRYARMRLHNVSALPTKSISAAVRVSNISTITTSSAHTLSPGDVVSVEGVSDATFVTTAVVLSVPDTTSFAYSNPGSDTSSSGGNVVPLNGTTNMYAILSASN